MKSENKRIIIWGTGFNAKRMNDIYPNEMLQEDIIGYVDNDKNKWGESFFGKKIFSPEEIKSMEFSDIYISINKKEEVVEQIREMFINTSVNILDNDYFKRKKMITRYSDVRDSEIQEIINYLRNNNLEVFNYPWVEEYKYLTIKIEREDGLFYVIHNGKKLFFSDKYDTEEKVREYYISLLIEQDKRSPHRYILDNFAVNEGDIVIDAGAAEGIFSLDIIDKAGKIYIFEPESEWISALKHTFSDYMDKIVIIDKCVSNYTDFNTTTIDKVVNEPHINFIKMDIEGEEYYALCGAANIIGNSKNIRVSVCTYHQEFAYEAIKNKLQEYGFKVDHSYGYMWYIEHFNIMRPMVLRRGLIRAEKREG